MVITAAAVAGAIVGFICALLRIGEKRRSQFYRGWLWLSAVVVLCLST